MSLLKRENMDKRIYNDPSSTDIIINRRRIARHSVTVNAERSIGFVEVEAVIDKPSQGITTMAGSYNEVGAYPITPLTYVLKCYKFLTDLYNTNYKLTESVKIDSITIEGGDYVFYSEFFEASGVGSTPFEAAKDLATMLIEDFETLNNEAAPLAPRAAEIKEELNRVIEKII